MGQERYLKLQILIADILLMSVVVCCTYWITIWINPAYIGGFQNMTKLVLLYDVCLLACNTIYPSILQNRIVRIDSIIRRSLIVSVLLLLLVSLITVMLEAQEHFPRTYTIATVGIFAILSVIERILIHELLKKLRSKRRNLKDVILIGNAPAIVRMYYVLNTPHYGYNILGTFFDGTSGNEEYDKLQIGKPNVIFTYLSSNPQVKEIYAYFHPDEQDKINMLSKYCDNHLIRFFYVPALDVFQGNIAFHSMEGVPVVARREEPLANPINKIVKRSFDLIISTIFLTLVFPWIYAIVGIIIKIKSPGPIFFKQKRTGLDGKVFDCYKFRTMQINDDADTLQATANDPRKYPFGDFMRRTSIDEFPQFINVWKGEMSIVGPRPHMLKHTDEYSKIINKYMVRHLAKPGITGLAQVYGYRGETKYIDQMEGRIKYDIEYIENWTLLMDIRIIFKTITNMFGKDDKAY